MPQFLAVILSPELSTSSVSHARRSFGNGPGNHAVGFSGIRIIDACAVGMGEFGVFRRSEGLLEFGPLAGPINSSEVVKNRADCISFLLEKGFQVGTNDWRGDFNSFIISQWLSEPENALAEALGIAVLKYRLSLGHKMINMTAPYHWFRNARTTRLFLAYAPEIELDEAFDTAVRYFSCAVDAEDALAARVESIRLLLDAGARPSTKIMLRYMGFNPSFLEMAITPQMREVLDRLKPRNPHGLLAPDNSILLSWVGKVHRERCKMVSAESPVASARLEILRPIWSALQKAIWQDDLSELRAFACTGNS